MAGRTRTDQPRRATAHVCLMSMNITGLDSATQIPVGATVTSARWQVPGPYGAGPEFDSQELALEHAIAAMRAAIARHAEAHPHPAAAVPLQQRITIDLRWTFSFPEGGSTDLVIQRTTYDLLDDATEHLSRIYRFGTGLIENMPPAQAEGRKRYLADQVKLALQASGPATMHEVLTTVASADRIAISQVKHGLNHAIAHGTVILTADDVLRLAA